MMMFSDLTNYKIFRKPIKRSVTQHYVREQRITIQYSEKICNKIVRWKILCAHTYEKFKYNNYNNNATEGKIIAKLIKQGQT